jgi:hypothetical protein
VLVVEIRRDAIARRRSQSRCWNRTQPAPGTTLVIPVRKLAEVKRRTKVIGRFPGETSCLTLVWAVLDIDLTHAKNGVRFNQLERQRLLRMRYAGNDQTNHEEEVTAA